MPDWVIFDMDPLLDSSNITVLEWNKIGRVIADHYASYDGFVVLHGTAPWPVWRRSNRR